MIINRAVLIFSFCVIALLTPSMVIASEVGGMTLNNDANDQINEAEAAYHEAREKLTPEQREYLDGIDALLPATMAPQIDIMKIGGGIEGCLTYDKEMTIKGDIYRRAFERYEKIKKKEKKRLWAEHKKLRDAAADFIDPTVLTGHMRVQTLLMLEEIGNQYRLAVQDSAMNCEEIRDLLSDFLPSEAKTEPETIKDQGDAAAGSGK